MGAYWVQFIFVASIILLMNMIAGFGVCTVLKMNMTPASCELTGAALISTYCEFTVVPMVLLKAPFNVVAVIIMSGYLFFVGFGIVSFYRSYRNNIDIGMKPDRGSLIMGILLYAMVIGITIFVIYKSLTLQHVDEDDTRFVVNAMDMIENNTVFLTNPARGNEILTWYGELLKDVVSPYSVFPATIAYFTGMKAVTAFHSVMPIILLVIISCLYYELAERFFRGRRDYKSLFVVFVWLVNIFGYYSVYGQETFMMTRLWQGKSIVAAIGVPAMIMLLLDVYNNSTDRTTYILLFMTNASMCFFSGMGIILMLIMTACYGLVYAIDQKNYRILLYLAVTCIPNVFCYIIHLGLRFWILR
ncbi:MAG TPA: hypothetical protein DCX23_07540 [Lachnospiraceae bacterium]|nr:hypothetical protein [Lachnospiraceae bacterium]